VVFPTTAKRVVFYAYYCSVKNNNSTCVRLQILENGSALYRIKNRQHRVHTVNNYIITFLSVFLLPYIKCILKRNILTAITEIRKTWI
jgi:hypothetical protein